MIHDVEAIYDHGVLRPVRSLSLPDGSRVQLRVAAEKDLAEKSNGAADYLAWLDGLAGKWQAEFRRGDKGSFETRELKDVVGTVDDLPPDASVNLDHYLYGTPKRQ